MADIELSERDTIPAPYVAQTTGRWDGDNGFWSTFRIYVGSPPQSFRVLPATIDPRISVITNDGCKGGMVNVSDCGDRRGVDYYNGSPSRGFQWSESGASTSSTYKYFNPYGEYTGQSIFRASGPFGNDTLTLSSKERGTNITLPSQVIAGVSDANFWLGTFGLGNSFTNYPQNSFTAPSLLYNMKNQSVIPSMSYGYTAGRYYDNKAEGSLILGGYDTNKMTSNMVTTKIQSSGSDSAQRLNINIQGILASGTISGGGKLNVLSESTVASIDSSLSHIYLPEKACDLLATNLGLTYDKNYDYYLVNDTMHDLLQGNNASLTFSLGGDTGAITLTMPYKSLDLQVGIPWYQPNRNYFPIRKAANSSQVILGRAFLQEAYIAVDWERGNFTLSPVNKASTAANILAITQPSQPSSTSIVTTSATAVPTNDPSPSGSGGIGAGAIAGIVVAVVLIAALGGLFFWWKSRPNNKRRSVFSMLSTRKSMPPPPYENSGLEYYGEAGNKPEEPMPETKSPHTHYSELYDSSKPAELTSDTVRRLEQVAQERELMSTPVAELGSGDVIGSELEDVPSNAGRDSITSASTTRRPSMVSPSRSEAVSPERTRSPLARETRYELE